MAILQGGSYLSTVTAEADLSTSTVALTVTAPDQTQTTVPSGQIDVEGTSASSAVLGSQLGTYLLVWVITGAYADVVQDQFTVEAPTLDLMSITELRDELNLEDAYTMEDAQLRSMLRRVRGVVENITGPIIPTAKTVLVDGGSAVIVLPDQWVVSITSVAESTGGTLYPLTEQPIGASIDGYGYTWDRYINVLTRRAQGSSPIPFAAGVGNVAITYVAGMPVIPPDIQGATARIIEHWWRKQQNPWRAGGMFSGTPSDDGGTAMVGNYEIPNAAMELLEPWRRSPGMA